MIELLKSVLDNVGGYAEIRYHKRVSTVVEARNASLAKAEQKTLAGAGVRCLVDGCWGFVSTSDVSEGGLRRALEDALQGAAAAAEIKKERVTLAPAKMGVGEFVQYERGAEPSIAEKIDTVVQAEAKLRSRSELIVGSTVRYTHYDDEKYIVNTDGAAAHILDSKQSMHVYATAGSGGKLETGLESWGVTGSWQTLMEKGNIDDKVDSAVKSAVEKLDAGYAPGGQYTVILDPQLVGVLSHEAIGHTVEADFVLSGSVVKGKIGQHVASDLVTMVDDGYAPGAAGMLLVDDEGVQGMRTVIIENGVLRNYLHNRESAAVLRGVPQGNARAFTYRDEPLIRMTNTFILPGKNDLNTMISEVEDGLFLSGLGHGGGQADATAEFMFSVAEARRIKDGCLGELIKGVTISGQAFDVLKSVDAVSGDFSFNMGAGHCGKWQPAKVDAGGPYLRCRVTVGGRHE